MPQLRTADSKKHKKSRFSVTFNRKRWSVRPKLIHSSIVSRCVVHTTKCEEESIFFLSDLFCALGFKNKLTMGRANILGSGGFPKNQIT